MPPTRPAKVSLKSSSLAGFLAWVVPGLGHCYLGHHIRGVIIMVVLAITFWTGVAIGGVKSTIDPQENRIWFIAQLCTGVHALTATIWSQHLDTYTHQCPNCKAQFVGRPDRIRNCPQCGQPIRPHEVTVKHRLAFWPQVDIAVVYSGIAGLLNVLVILDAIARAEIEPLQRAAARGKEASHG